jgi:short-subunit dehydrogenase
MKKIIFISGSTEGIGKSTAKGLLLQGHHVVIHGRNGEKVKQTVIELQQITNSKAIDSFVCDLSNLEDVAKMAKNINNKFAKLDVLINNAGTMNSGRVLTKDGFE